MAPPSRVCCEGGLPFPLFVLAVVPAVHVVRCLQHLSSLPFAVSALCHPCHSPLFPVSAVCHPWHVLFPAVCCSLLSVVRCPCCPLSPPSTVCVVPSCSPVVTTPISPYEQWLVGGVAVVCDVASVLVQEKDLLPPCEQRLAAVARGVWCSLPSLLSRGKNLKRIKLVSKKGE
jgi:hypothetical protein